MTPTQITQISLALADARNAMMHAAKTMGKHKGKGAAHRKRKVEQLEGAARMLQEWIDNGEPEGYQ